jgi:membrane-associated PAP2 superfamily phosphatase
MPRMPRATPRPLWQQDLLVAVIALLALIAWDASGADLWAMSQVGGAEGFAWREHWLTSRVLHQGGRAAGWVVFGLLLLGIWWPLPFARALPRAARVWWVGATLACVALIPLLKARSLSSCPWDLAEFGGAAQYVSHWLRGVADGGPGRCFPSGHASAAFAFLSGWFALRVHAPRAARWWLLGVLLAGLLFGGAQMMRGAHYPSHTAWTGWICFVLCAALSQIVPALRGDRNGGTLAA